MKHKQRQLGLKVSPRSFNEIAIMAQKTRDAATLLMPKRCNKKLDIIAYFDILQYTGVIEFTIEEDENLNGQLALTYPDRGIIRISQTVYDGACEGDGHHRFTLAHELGHLLMHAKQNPLGYARNYNEHKIYEDSEWQADTFASELLIDSRRISGFETAEEISDTWGVSETAAMVKLLKIKGRR